MISVHGTTSSSLLLWSERGEAKQTCCLQGCKPKERPSPGVKAAADRSCVCLAWKCSSYCSAWKSVSSVVERLFSFWRKAVWLELGQILRRGTFQRELALSFTVFQLLTEESCSVGPCAVCPPLSEACNSCKWRMFSSSISLRPLAYFSSNKAHLQGPDYQLSHPRGKELILFLQITSNLTWTITGLTGLPPPANMVNSWHTKEFHLSDSNVFVGTLCAVVLESTSKARTAGAFLLLCLYPKLLVILLSKELGHLYVYFLFYFPNFPGGSLGFTHISIAV